jgi:DNA-directed RNA polymerase specialized sigma24 family protein
LPAEASLEATQLDALIAQERQRDLYRSVAKLSDEQQRALLLRFAGGLEYDEIAQIAKRPAATLRARVFLALRRLRRLVRKADDR